MRSQKEIAVGIPKQQVNGNLTSLVSGLKLDSYKKEHTWLKSERKQIEIRREKKKK